MFERTVRVGLLVLAFGPLSSATGYAAETAHAKSRRTTTGHPVKPPSEGPISDRTGVEKTAPDVTSTIVKPHDSASSPAGAEEPIPPPYLLPAATRARVRACGTTWRDMKLSGRTGDDDWRDFAVKCFTAKDDPPAAR